MKAIRLIASILFLVGVAGIFVPSLYADKWNKKTKVVLNERVQIPGTVLEPGTYWFKLVDSAASRNIVCITNENEDHTYAIVLAIPNYRLKPTEKTTLGFWETPRGNPVALRSWFYPGDNFGQEFAYPKHMAEMIATEEHAPVPAVPEEVTPKMIEPPEQAPAVAELKKAPVEVVPAPKPEPATETAATTMPKELPQTASPLPLLALFGGTLTAAGMLVRVVRMRFAR